MRHMFNVFRFAASGATLINAVSYLFSAFQFSFVAFFVRGNVFTLMECP